MSWRDVPQSEMSLGEFVRPDGQRFALTVIVYLTPSQYDYRLAVFDAAHETWGHMRFQAVVPKRAAESDGASIAVVVGPIAEQVRATLMTATSTGRDLALTFSPDGWSLF